MKALNYILFYCSKALRVLGNVILAAILLTITAGIISRYVFGKPFTWTEELSTLLMVSLGYISAVVVTVEKKHIVADFLVANAPPHFKHGVSVFSNVVAICVFVFICVSSSHMLFPKIIYRTPALGIPRSVFYWPIFSTCAFMIFAVVVDILNGIFPGYNVVEIAAKKEAELAIRQGLKEAAESEKAMDEFLQQAAPRSKL